MNTVHGFNEHLFMCFFATAILTPILILFGVLSYLIAEDLLKIIKYRLNFLFNEFLFHYSLY